MNSFRKTPPPIRDFVNLEIPSAETFTLKEGLTLHTVRTGESPANRFSFLWNYGKMDTPCNYGAFLLPSMLMQGTTRMTGAEITDNIDFLGAFVINNVGNSYSSFNSVSLNTFTDSLLKIFEDMVLNPLFPVDRFEALKRQALAAYDLKHARTSVVAFERLSELLVGKNHPYGVPVKREWIENVTLDEVRDAWKKGLFNTPIDIFAAGDITDSLYRDIERFALAIRGYGIEVKPKTAVPCAPEAPGRTDIAIPGTRQSSVAIGIPTIKRDNPDYIPLRIAVIALGGYFGSRLMTNIREEKGLTYGINASLEGSREGAAIKITADCDAAYVDRVIEEVGKEMHAMTSLPMPQDELRRLRSYYMTVLASVLESFRSIGEYYEGLLTVGMPDDYFEQQQSALAAATPESIMETAARYFRFDNARVVVAV